MSEQMYTPPPVSGYRVLTQAEVDLMNRIKAHELMMLALVREVMKVTDAAHRKACLYDEHFLAPDGQQYSSEESYRIVNAEPWRWGSIARTNLQIGFMALVRAVAQPVTP